MRDRLLHKPDGASHFANGPSPYGQLDSRLAAGTIDRGAVCVRLDFAAAGCARVASLRLLRGDVRAILTRSFEDPTAALQGAWL